FRGGTSVTLQFKQIRQQDGSIRQVKLTRAEVEKRVKDTGAAASPNDPTRRLQEARVIAVNADADRVTSGTFEVKSLATNPEAVQSALIAAFSDVLESSPPSKFVGSDLSAPAAPIFPITDPVLGANIGRPSVQEPVSDSMGGAAIVLENL